MKREEKKAQIDEIAGVLSDCSGAVFTEYRGIAVNDLTNMRKKLRESGIRYKIVKNTLARFAAEQAGKDNAKEIFTGPVAMAYGYGEPNDAAKALKDYIKATKQEIKILGGFVDDRLITDREVTILAELPPREVLIAKVLASMQSPVARLVRTISNPLSGMVGVLQARAKQLENA